MHAPTHRSAPNTGSQAIPSTQVCPSSQGPLHRCPIQSPLAHSPWRSQALATALGPVSRQYWRPPKVTHVSPSRHGPQRARHAPSRHSPSLHSSEVVQASPAALGPGSMHTRVPSPSQLRPSRQCSWRSHGVWHHPSTQVVPPRQPASHDETQRPARQRSPSAQAFSV